MLIHPSRHLQMDVYGVLVGVQTAAKIAENNVQNQKHALRKLVKQISDGEQQLIETVAKRDALVNEMLINPVSKSNLSALNTCEEQLALSDDARGRLLSSSNALVSKCRDFYMEMESARRETETKMNSFSDLVQKLHDGKKSMAERAEEQRRLLENIQPHQEKLERAREDLSCFEAVQRSESERANRLRSKLDDFAIPQCQRVEEENKNLLATKSSHEKLLTTAQQTHNSLLVQIMGWLKKNSSEGYFETSTNELENAIARSRGEYKHDEALQTAIEKLVKETQASNLNLQNSPIMKQLPDKSKIEDVFDNLVQILETNGNCSLEALLAMTQNDFENLLRSIKLLFESKLSTNKFEVRSNAVCQAMQEVKAAMDMDAERKEKLLKEKSELEEQLCTSI